jgi:tRNA (guanine-N7-)-methyltransferase
MPAGGATGGERVDLRARLCVRRAPPPVPLDLYANIRDQRLAALRAEFFPRLPLAAGAPLTLELGCGHGHYLNAYAAAHPGEFCIGLDLLADRIERATRKATRARLANLAFVQAEAALFLSALAAYPASCAPPLPPARLRRVFVLFSDPWPKRRHWKHRVLQPALLDTLAPLAAPGAALHFRTDHPDYFAYARAVVAEHAAWRLASPDEPAEAWPFEHVSVFEERALAGAPQSFTALRR